MHKHSFRRLAVLTLIPTLAATAAFAMGGEKASFSEGAFVLQIVLLVIVGRLLGEAMVRIGQPSIVGQIIGGILLGPSVLGALFPDLQAHIFPHEATQANMTEAVAVLGTLFLLLLAGMETDLRLAMRLRQSAVGISLAGIAIPFACGFALGEFMPQFLLPDPNQRLVASLFLGTALSISSVKIVASVVREMDFLRRNIGQLIVASSIIDDTIGWVIIAFTFSLAQSGKVDIISITTSVVGTLAFMAISFTIGRRFVFEAIRFTNDRFKSDLPVLSAIIAIMGGMAMITDAIGVHTVLGAFVAGILVGESPILTRQIDNQLRALTTALFMPVFFGLTGLKTDLSVLLDPNTLLLTIGLIVVASVGKFGGAFFGAKLNGFSNAEAIALGSGMNARGSTEVIIATIGLNAGVLNERLFSAIVAMALVTTMAMPPMLRWALSRLPMRHEEEKRLKREEHEEGSFIGRFERILLPVDLSASSDLAARLAASLAISRKTPVTVLNITGQKTVDDKKDTREKASGSADDDDIRSKTETFAETLRSHTPPLREKEEENSGATEKTKAPAGDGIHVTTVIRQDEKLEKLLSEGAEKGHDIMITGVEPVGGDNGGFSERLALMAGAFDGTVAIAAARGSGAAGPSGDLRILVAVSETERSIRAVEFACAVAKAESASISVIYIAEPTQTSRRPRFGQIENDRHAAAFERVDEIAEFNQLKISKSLQEGSSPEVSILRHARRGRFNLIVVGVSRRAGEKLSYGTIADNLLEAADRSILFIETE